jgi:hypothetical protein
MHENICSPFPFDKTIPLLVVKPLNHSFCQSVSLLEKIDPTYTFSQAVPMHRLHASAYISKLGKTHFSPFVKEKIMNNYILLRISLIVAP